MNSQNQVFLSIGSNQGNRLENITNCISFIHNNIGTVISVSKLYETSSWGFESADFYNCAVLLHTNFTAEKILNKILKIEKKLGRIRNSNEYQARIIDIDIIGFNNEVLQSENLIVPHPQMQNRLFVLIPLTDLSVQYQHPGLNKNPKELIAICSDNSKCRMVGDVVNPIEKYNFQKLNYLVIEGNIGTGKTTFTTKIAEDFNAKKVLERFADNPFLPKFYKDQSRYAFPLEMSFLADRYQQLSDDLAQFDLFKDFIVADYHIFKSSIFAKVTLTEDEYRLYRKLFEIIYKEMKKPDLYVYLYQNTERLLKNIKKRGRNYEQKIPKEYLENISKGYLDFIKTQTGLNILVIDVSEKDFVKNQKDYIFILDQIQSAIDNM